MATKNTRALALTLDLDGPSEYARLHGLAANQPGEKADLVMYGSPLRRFADLCRATGVKGTLFVIGRDIAAGAASVVATMAQQGFEIASHSQAHDYRLSRASPEEIKADLYASLAAITDAIGVRPRGFRAPGYHLSPALLGILGRLGFLYDSSAMPSPPYFMVKAAVLSWYRLCRRHSAALLGTFSTAVGPRDPYCMAVRTVDDRVQRTLLELPISVATPWRLPVTGASLVLAPRWVRTRLIASLAPRPVVVLNLHAMDLLDADRDGISRAIAARQPELRLPVVERQRILSEVVSTLTAGRRLLTCSQIASVLADCSLSLLTFSTYE